MRISKKISILIRMFLLSGIGFGCVMNSTENEKKKLLMLLYLKKCSNSTTN